VEELELDAGDEREVLISVVAGSGGVSSLRGGGGCEVLNERGTSRRGEGGRKCLLWVIVFVEGVRESGGAVSIVRRHSRHPDTKRLPPGRGELGILVSTRGSGLSLGLIERDEGGREAVSVSFAFARPSGTRSHPPLPSRFMGRPPITGV
jgi:hypothetical protein